MQFGALLDTMRANKNGDTKSPFIQHQFTVWQALLGFGQDADKVGQRLPFGLR